MDRIDFKIQRALIRHWDDLKDCLSALNLSASIKPADDVLKHVSTNDDMTNFELVPVLLMVPERAYHSGKDLYVVLTGKLTIDRAHYVLTEQLRTLKFATEVGYFRVKTNAKILEHVFGAHYDLDEDAPGHPVFHAQIKSFAEFADEIKKQDGFDDFEVLDRLSHVLNRVRLPSAQMDIFSSFLQIIADHLLAGRSGENEKAKFTELLQKSKFLQGVGSKVNRLQILPASHCYRAVHWYRPSDAAGQQ